MPTEMTSRKRKSIEMQKRIQRVAINLFEKHGFENVSVEDIAKAAGCSVGNIYYYFNRKEDLALQLVSNIDHVYSALEQQYDADTIHTSKEKLLDYIEKALLTCSEDEFVYMGIIHGLKYPEQGVLKYREDRPFFKLMLKLIQGCQQEGSIRADADSLETMRLFSVLIRGTLIEWRLNEGNFDLASSGHYHASTLLEGLAPGKRKSEANNE